MSYILYLSECNMGIEIERGLEISSIFDQTRTLTLLIDRYYYFTHIYYTTVQALLDTEIRGLICSVFFLFPYRFFNSLPNHNSH